MTLCKITWTWEHLKELHECEKLQELLEMHTDHHLTPQIGARMTIP